MGHTSRSADQARAILAQAEREVRDLLSQGLPAGEQTARSREIVARAQREVSDILARGPAEDQHVAAQTGLGDVFHSPEPAMVPFAALSAVVLPAPEGELWYRLSGRLTLATLLAFQQAVDRLPGVTSARVSAEPGDVAELRLTTSEPGEVQDLLVAIPGVELRLEIEAA